MRTDYRRSLTTFRVGLEYAARAFDVKVAEFGIPFPDTENGERVCCHPVVTTEADVQRWFGCALENAFRNEQIRVHAEVHAATGLRHRRKRVDLTLHRARTVPFHDERAFLVDDVILCLEIKVLHVGRHDRAWREPATMKREMEALYRGVECDFGKTVRGSSDLLSVVFLEPLAYTRARVEADTIADRFRGGATHKGWFVLHPARPDGTPGCLAILSRTPFTEST